MANADARFGLMPVKHRNGAPYNGAANPYYIPSGYGTALFVNDPVVITGTSNTAVIQGDAGAFYEIGTLPEINRATAGAGNTITGVIVGFQALRTDLDKQYNAASTERIAMVADDPDLLFWIQDDGVSSTPAATDVGLNADIIFTHAGSTITGLSGAELDIDTKASTATLQLKILRMVNRQDVEMGVNAIWEVMINQHTLRAGIAGID